LQPVAPLNPRGLGMLAPTTIFNSVASFMTNTNVQHYAGDQNFFIGIKLIDLFMVGLHLV
jgi:potassium-transporting ATPase potassium-binding subunit